MTIKEYQALFAETLRQLEDEHGSVSSVVLSKKPYSIMGLPGEETFVEITFRSNSDELLESGLK